MQKPSASTASIMAMAAFWSVTLAAAAQTKDSPAPAKIADYRISGTVVSKLDGHPLDRVRVLLGDSKTRRDPRSFVTSEDGKFLFENVGAGKYTLQGLKAGFVPSAYEQHDQYSTGIVTGAGLNTENLTLKLSPRAIISGRVLDEVGEPVRHAMVALYRTDHLQGVDEVVGASNAQTDDLGAYELPSLLPGWYFLAVHAQPWYAIHPATAANHTVSDGSNGETTDVDRSLDVAYPVTYYQNATETDSATPIPIRGGEHLQIEMNLNPVPALRLLFNLPADQSHGFAMPQIEQLSFDGSTSVQTMTQSVGPGVMELTGIPAGRYNIRIPGQKTMTQLNGVELSKDGELDTSAGEPLGTVKMSVKVAGETALAPVLAAGLVRGRTPVGGFYPFSPKGQVEIPEVAAGNYGVRVVGGNKPYTITGMTAEGAQVKGRTVTVPAGASVTIALTVAAGVEVQGVVKKAGKPFAEAMVVLVPKDVEGNRDLFRRDQSDLDGTFSLRAVVPGSYTLVAIEDGWDLDWSLPGVITPYLKRGRPVEIHRETSNPVKIEQAVELQSK